MKCILASHDETYILEGEGQYSPVTYRTRDHEKHETHHNQVRSHLSGGSWRRTVRERIRMADTPAIAQWPAAIY